MKVAPHDTLKMKVLLPVFLLTSVYAQELKIFDLFHVCDRFVTLDYHRGLQDFSNKLFKKIAIHNNDHFALSQYSIWLFLSAIAEATDDQKQLHGILNLPKNPCLREKYYEIATSLESPGNDVYLKRNRLLILDNELKVNNTWVQAVRSSGLIDTKTAPIREPEILAKQLKELKMSQFKLIGNSVILDTLDYEGLWTTAFDNSTTEINADFFNDNGQIIGKVDLIKIRKRFRMCFIPLLMAKLLELPVGHNGRYRMMFILNLGSNNIRRLIENFPSSLIIDSLSLLVESLVPIEVSIPKFKMTTEMDLRNVLVDLGMGSIWNDANVYKYISQPAPTLTIRQRVTISIDSPGLEPPPQTGATGAISLMIPGTRFVANRPFVYGLLDSETRTWLFSGVYSRPD